MLRSWHEEAKQNQLLQQLRIVLTYSTEIYVSLKQNQSPFNIGLALNLPDFNLEQVQSLAERYGLQCKSGNALEACALDLINLVGGHPYLIHLALYHLANLVKINSSTEQEQLETLLQEATTVTGIYGEYLREHLAKLKANPELAHVFMQVVAADAPVSIDPIVGYQLESLGLVKLNGNSATPRYLLYRQFFGSQDWFGNSLSQSLEQLQQQNQALQRCCTIENDILEFY